MSAVQESQANPLPQPEWLSYLQQEEWGVFCEMLRRAHDAELEMLLGGGLALSAYTPLRRWTKDLDFYIRPGDRDRAVALLNEAGFADYYDQLPYDRSWIYRGFREGVIVDIIWSFANHLTEVDEEWFIHSRRISFDGFDLRIMPPEELTWPKLFVFQRERCDWPDLLNLLYYAGPDLNWPRLRSRLGPDEPLLEGLLTVFHWLCPAHLLEHRDVECQAKRVKLLDSRDWFLPQFTPSAP